MQQIMHEVWPSVHKTGSRQYSVGLIIRPCGQKNVCSVCYFPSLPRSRHKRAQRPQRHSLALTRISDPNRPTKQPINDDS